MNKSPLVRYSFVISFVAAILLVSGLLFQPALADKTPPVSKATPTPLPPSSSGDGDTSPSAPRPVAVPDNGPDARTTAQAPSVTFSYFRLLGVAFNGRTSTTTYAYNFNGCIYETGGADNRFMAPLIIPDGSVIKYLRLYYNDTSAVANLTAWITRYQPGITSEDLTSVDSVGNTGYGSTLSQEITHTVDMANWAYTLIVAPNSNTVSNTICGIRVAYYAPIVFGAFLPTIYKQ